MLTEAQQDFFAGNGYLVVDVFDQLSVLDPVRAEYATRLDTVIDAWVAAGDLDPLPPGLDFFGKLGHCYLRGLDWFQPLDTSLPGDEIAPDTPMHFGPAVFRLLTDAGLLDIVESLIGPEITGEWLPAVPACCRIARKPRPLSPTVSLTSHMRSRFRSGGIVLLHPLTPHCSLANSTGGFRWSFDIRFNRTGHPAGRAHFPEFVARSRSDPASELHDSRAWKSSWEAARAVLSRQPHIHLHRWASDAPFCA